MDLRVHLLELTLNFNLGQLNPKEEKNKMEKNKMNMGYPAGYYEMGMSEEDYKKMMKKKGEYHDMDGYKMKGKKHTGPEGYWGIPGMSRC